ncbi:MAG: thiamine pyrophosphate-dependent enzyme [Thiotrichales bacterium]|nr:thiamine pyrophosphate-dependent enzyme [Thiotrichales bacterium]
MNTSGASPEFLLDRNEAVPQLVGRHEDFLIVAGLAGTARDLTFLSRDAPHVFALAGAMGAATSMGLGLALARPERRVLVITGDGELLMNVGTLATAAVMNPPNLAIVCVDNGRYGETGWQKSHTSLGVDLEQMAIGAGIRTTRLVTRPEQIPEASRLIRDGNGASFVLMRVKPTESPPHKRDLDPATERLRFRAALPD